MKWNLPPPPSYPNKNTIADDWPSCNASPNRRLKLHAAETLTSLNLAEKSGSNSPLAQPRLGHANCSPLPHSPNWTHESLTSRYGKPLKDHNQTFRRPVAYSWDVSTKALNGDGKPSPLPAHLVRHHRSRFTSTLRIKFAMGQL